MTIKPYLSIEPGMVADIDTDLFLAVIIENSLRWAWNQGLKNCSCVYPKGSSMWCAHQKRWINKCPEMKKINERGGERMKILLYNLKTKLENEGI